MFVFLSNSQQRREKNYSLALRVWRILAYRFETRFQLNIKKWRRYKSGAAAARQSYTTTQTHITYHTHIVDRRRNVREREQIVSAKHGRNVCMSERERKRWKRMSVCNACVVCGAAATECMEKRKLTVVSIADILYSLNALRRKIIQLYISLYSWQTCALAQPNARIERKRGKGRKKHILQPKQTEYIQSTYVDVHVYTYGIDQAKKRKNDIEKKNNKNAHTISRRRKIEERWEEEGKVEWKRWEISGEKE